jgi:hypothetical protein
MRFMDHLSFTGRTQRDASGLFGLDRPRLPPGDPRITPAPRPVSRRPAEAPPRPLDPDEIAEAAREWRRMAAIDGRSPRVADALEALAEDRRAPASVPSFEPPKTLAQRISDFMGL